MPTHRDGTLPELSGNEISRLTSQPQMDWVHLEDQTPDDGICWQATGRWTNTMDRREDVREVVESMTDTRVVC